MCEQEPMQRSLDEHKTWEEKQIDVILQMRKTLAEENAKNVTHAATEDLLLAALRDIVRDCQTSIETSSGTLDAHFIKARASRAIVSYFQTINNLK